MSDLVVLSPFPSVFIPVPCTRNKSLPPNIRSGTNSTVDPVAMLQVVSSLFCSVNSKLYFPRVSFQCGFLKGERDDEGQEKKTKH